MPLQTTQIDRWIVSRIQSDSTLMTLIGGRVVSEVAKKGILFPYLLITTPSPPIPAYAQPARAIAADAVIVIRGVAKTDSYGGDLETIANRILFLFHQPPINVTYRILSSILDAEFRLAETQEETQYRHLGGRFRITTY